MIHPNWNKGRRGGSERHGHDRICLRRRREDMSTEEASIRKLVRNHMDHSFISTSSD
jgi:hypothetical protein